MDKLITGIPVPLNEYKRRLIAARSFYSFPFLSRKLGVNRYYLWHLINTEGYRPPEWVCDHLGIKYPKTVPAPVCPQCGIVHLAECPQKSNGHQPKKKRKPRDPYVHLPLNDPEKARRVIEANYPEFISEFRVVE